MHWGPIVEETFAAVTATAMLIGVGAGIAALVFGLLAIPYRLIFKRDKGPGWYATVTAVPLCCFAFAITMFFLRAFSPNFFGQPGGVKITHETKRLYGGTEVRTERLERTISLESAASGVPSEQTSPVPPS